MLMASQEPVAPAAPRPIATGHGTLSVLAMSSRALFQVALEITLLGTCGVVPGGREYVAGLRGILTSVLTVTVFVR
jgi:hypothetical protein